MNRSSEKLEQKKPYQAPKLLIYGNLTEMTKGTGAHGKKDGGGGLFRRLTGK
ncbi:MAG TPA: hypothetical protein VMU53_10305 [Candidatus Sulfotelmatobacter sp.]|nr:hypothetical protein [Candidatus Sulfotelmatobacter sp.]